MQYKYDYAVIGGDMRQVYLAEKLAGSSHRVCHFALCGQPEKRRSAGGPCLDAASSLEEACTLSACIAGPVPLCRNGLFINQNALDERISAGRIFSNLKSGQFLFGGCIPEEQRVSASKKGARVFDLMEDPALSYFNTIATAEGAICEAIRHSPQNLRHSSCAILGYGKCGRTLCQYLKGMSCRIFAADRQDENRAQAALISDQTGTPEQFAARAGEFDFIFNTIPAAVITCEALSKMKSTVTIIDIASAPGGVDFKTAGELGLTALLCPGLPGKYAPASSAGAIKEAIERIMKESNTECH